MGAFGWRSVVRAGDDTAGGVDVPADRQKDLTLLHLGNECSVAADVGKVR